MKRINYLLMLLFIFPLCLAAQQRTITGNVTNQDGTPAAGVTVSVVVSSGNAPAGVTTGSKGEYSISTPANATTLVFKSLGLLELKEPINGRISISVVMAPNDEALSEVVITGYGSTQNRKTMTSSVSTVNAKQIQTSTNTSLAAKLQGKMSGLYIRNNTGQPGKFDNSIDIRGFGTPLIVIDGVVRGNDNAATAAFQRLNPEDIEDVTIIKDASAAIYGLEGANGVILVTTKKGTTDGKPIFSIQNTTGYTKLAISPAPSSIKQYVDIYNDAGLYSQATNWTPSYTKDVYDAIQAGAAEDPAGYVVGTQRWFNTQWKDVLMKDHSELNTTNFSVRGGNQKSNYYVSLGYQTEGAMLKQSDAMGYNKYNLNTRLNAEIAKNFTADVLIGGYVDKTWETPTNFFNLWKNTVLALPYESPYAGNIDDGKHFALLTGLFGNAAPQSKREVGGYIDSYGKQLKTSVQLVYKTPIKGLSLKSNLAYDLTNNNSKSLSKSYNLYTYNATSATYTPAPATGTNALSLDMSNSNQLYFTGTVNYQARIKNHSLTAFVVAEERKNWGDGVNGRRLYGEFYTTDINFGSINQTGLTNGGSYSLNAVLGYAGKLIYSYANKYNVELSARYNGSSKYAPGQRWGLFPIASASWVVSEENFMKNHVPFVSLMKIYGTYGKNAAETGNSYQWFSGFGIGAGTYEFSDAAGTVGLSAPQVANTKLTWASTRQTDIGLTLGLFDGKLNFNGQVFRKDQIGNAQTPAGAISNTFGGSLPQENLESTRSQGFDMDLVYTGKIKNVRFNVGPNFSYNRRMNLHTIHGVFNSQSGMWTTNNVDGRWSNRQTGYIYIGQFQSEDEINDINTPLVGGGTNYNVHPGSYNYKDVNGDGVINGSDDDAPRTFGSTPLTNYGATIGFTWKDLSASMLFQGQGRYSMQQSEVYSEILGFGGTGVNALGYFHDRWHQADPYDKLSAWIPGQFPVTRKSGDMGTDYERSSSQWTTDANFVRLKNVNLSYQFNQKFLKTLGISNFKITLDAYNLMTFTKDPLMKIYDPEKNNGAYAYPLARNYNLGLTANF